jgi:cobalamin biosynthesis protein CobW
MNMPRVPATIVTGFLGAGKTSLVRHLLAHAGGRRLAVIVNEFGELGIDRGLLNGCGDVACSEDDIVELANGCICCTVADDFLPTLTRLLDREAAPEHILIETSGLALPKPLVQAFAWPEVKTRTTVDGVLTMIDAAEAATDRYRMDPNLSHDQPIAEVFEDQLACADLVILNKTDLVDPPMLDALKAGVASRLRPGVRLVAASHGRVPVAVALGMAAAAEDDLSARPSVHDATGEHDHDDFESFVVTVGAVADAEVFRARINAVLQAHPVLRLKGFVDRPDRDRRQVVQAVGTRVDQYFDRPWQPGERRRTELVVIGERGLDRAAITAALTGWML